MTPDREGMEMQAPQGVALQGMAVECVVFDHADRPKRRHLLPLASLLKPLTVGMGGRAVEAR